MADPVIALDHVTKRFGTRRALDDVSLAIAPGETVGLLGPNGAGKTTLLSLVLGLLLPTSGEVRVRGVSTREPWRARQRVGSLIAPAFHDYLSAWDNLRVLASYSGPVDEAELADAVRFVGLADRIHERVRALSHGMRRRLGLAQALVPAPEIVLLDEPEEGLDPEGIAEMRGLVVRLRRERGVTVALASHQLAGVEETCERVVILDRGRVVHDARIDALDDATPRLRLDVDDWPRAATLAASAGARVVGDGVVALADGVDAADVVAALVQAGIKVRAVEPLRRTLAELYLRTVAAAAADDRPA